MSDANPQEIIGVKKKREASLGGAVLCAFFNAFLGVLLGFVALAATPAKDYKPAMNPKTGKPVPFPVGVWYWQGTGGGDWRAKEPLFLAEKPGEVVVTQGDLNAWAQANMKGAAIAAKAPPKPASAGAKNTAAPANTGPTFEMNRGTPNFHIFHDPLAPESVPVTFQIALPFSVTVLGYTQPVILQVRGVFAQGPQGPRLEPYYAACGSARIPVALVGMALNSVSSAFAATDDGKAYVAAWGKYGGAVLRDGELVLTGK